jgi:hypothetical protein
MTETREDEPPKREPASKEGGLWQALYDSVWARILIFVLLGVVVASIYLLKWVFDF